MDQNKYDVIVIGCGSGGLSVGLFMDAIGLNVLMVSAFPEEIAGLLDDVLVFCTDLRERREEYAKEWSNRSIIMFDYWLSLPGETETLIKRLRYDMIRSRHVFAEQLFQLYGDFLQ